MLTVLIVSSYLVAVAWSLLPALLAWDGWRQGRAAARAVDLTGVVVVTIAGPAGDLWSMHDVLVCDEMGIDLTIDAPVDPGFGDVDRGVERDTQ